jgi:hypothetical protein
MNNSRRNSTPSKPDQRSANKPNLQAGRDQLTGQVAVMSDHDRASYSVFVQAFVDDFQPRSAFARQLARRLGEDNWRLNRLHAIEDNIFAWAHSGPYRDMEAEHPQIHHAMMQALTFRDDPQLFALISLYERRLTQNLQASLKMLLQLESLPQLARPRREETTAAAKLAEVPEIARAATGQFVLQNPEKAA